MNETQASQLPVYAGNDLGAVWCSSATAFRLWAPTACSAALHRFATGTDAEPEAADLGTLAMQRSEGGTWYLELAGDLAGQYYQYELQFPDGTSTVTADPYAHAAGAGGTRSMVLNQAAAVPDGWQKDERPAIPAHARSVWEVHVADFTADPASGVPQAYRGKFMGFTVDGTTLNGDGVHPTGLNYLKRLGVTHVQLQPIFDFATVDEVSGEDYNWGYDPLNYNLPEGSYATDAFHGEVRVRECRAMVQALHSAGLGVVMDVVYNHTYYSNSWLERTVPGYWNRRWENGSLTNGSGCGCDLASERTMVRKYLVDSCVYWAKEYHIDGFRFDLMALHDVETMNAIRAALDALPGGEDILMYGEPWQGGSTRMEHGAIPANKQAAGLLDSRIGFFCDNTRDAIKGGVFNAGITAEQLSICGATIANEGLNPNTNKQVFDKALSPKITSMIATVGFYQHTGDWLYTSGIPAKTGVGGGVMGVMPGVMGIAAFAPPLDDAGNSVKAQLAIKHIMNKLGMNVFNGHRIHVQ